MRHLKKGRKFHRKKGQRKALIRGLLNNLVKYEKIETTEAKAKEIKPIMEKMITLGKKQNIASLRILNARLNKPTSQKIFYEIAPRYKERSGGYLRIIKSVKTRKNDGSRMAKVEFV